MNCKEVRAHFEDLRRNEAELCKDCAEVIEHVAHCPECNRFAEMQRELARSLRLARESAPELPASLDAAVLENYRRNTPAPGAIRLPGKPRPYWVLRWSAGCAVVIVVATLLLLSRGRPAVTAPRSAVVQHPTAPQQAHTEAVQASIPVHAQPKRVRTVARPVKHSPSSTVGPVLAGNPLPAEFSSLMFCDELSCGGAMEMIRVQLPYPVEGAAVGPAQSNGVVVADVLVGADGIARGIRIEQ